MTRFWRPLTPADWTGDERGSVMPMFVIALVAILSLVGAAIALGLDSRAASNLQITADESALSGATAFINTASPKASDRLAAAEQAAQAAAMANANFSIVKLDVGAITEDAYGQRTVIDVALKFTPANPAAQMAGRNANIGIERTAAAAATWGFPLCILGLNANDTGLSTTGLSNLTAENCIVWTNSPDTRSMEFKGGTAKTKYFCSAGNAFIASAIVSPKPDENCDPIPDPLASWQAPLPGKAGPNPFPVSSKNKTPNIAALSTQFLKAIGVPAVKSVAQPLAAALKSGQPLTDSQTQLVTASLNTLMLTVGGPFSSTGLDKKGVFTKGAAKGMHIMEVAQVLGIADNLPDSLYSADVYASSPTTTLSPGTYAGLDIAQGNVRLKPGVYHIVGAPLIVRRKTTLTGEGVTIVFHGDKATFSVLDQARATITAPTAGETAGFSIAENRHSALKSKTAQRSRLTGSGAVSMIGTIYVPRQKFAITGKGAADQASHLLQLVADKIELENMGALKIKFDPSRTDVPMTIEPERAAVLIR